MAITAAIVGGAAVVGGTAAAIRAQRMKTKPKRSYFGGDAGTYDAYRQQSLNGIAQGNQGYVDAKNTLHDAGQVASIHAATDARNQQLKAQTLEGQIGQREAMSALNAYQPGAVSQAQAQQAVDAGAQANLGAARSGGALGLRNALNANAQGNVQVAQNAAAQRAQEEQALLAAKVQQSNNDLARVDAIRNAGTNAYLNANQQYIQTGATQGQLGLTNQAQNLGFLSNIEGAQLGAEVDYDTRRQAENSKKSDRLWNLGAGLIGGGAKLLGGGGG